MFFFYVIMESYVMNAWDISLIVPCFQGEVQSNSIMINSIILEATYLFHSRACLNLWSHSGRFCTTVHLYLTQKISNYMLNR